MNYVQVNDCDATAAKATSLGGKVCMPPTDIPNTGRFAMIQDPQGAMFSVIALAPMQKG
jgi:predicted enzyme related to lactoylglutathione lyase